MPIRQATLKKHGEKYVILMDGTKTLSEALRRLRENDYQENQTYLVVARADKQYQVALFSELKSVVALMGYDSLVQPLHTLPIPFADWPVPTNTPRSGQEIIDLVASNPQSTVVVVEGDQVVGLFANPNRSGVAGWLEKLSLLELHGKPIQLDKDPRADFEARVAPPVCPHCGKKNFFSFDPQHQTYICPSCGKVVRQL
jgi:hypothetical protein